MDSSGVGVSDGTTWSQRQPHRRCQEPIGVKDSLIGGVRNIQKSLKVIIVLMDCFSRLVEIFKGFLIHQLLGYRIKPFGAKENLIGCVRNV
jgi:hypothetical protein